MIGLKSQRLSARQRMPQRRPSRVQAFTQRQPATSPLRSIFLACDADGKQLSSVSNVGSRDQTKTVAPVPNFASCHRGQITCSTRWRGPTWAFRVADRRVQKARRKIRDGSIASRNKYCPMVTCPSCRASSRTHIVTVPCGQIFCCPF